MPAPAARALPQNRGRPWRMPCRRDRLPHLFELDCDKPSLLDSRPPWLPGWPGGIRRALPRRMVTAHGRSDPEFSTKPAPRVAGLPRQGPANLLVARLAIADDDPDSLDLLIETLQSPTTDVSSAASGAELVALLTEKGPFDLIVTDVSMPWMEGLSVMRSARAGRLRTPVLVITGLARPDLERSVEEL